MDINWKTEEVLMTLRDGVYLTPEQEARMQIALTPRRHPGDLRRAAATAMLAVARRLDPESVTSPGVTLEHVQGRPA
jgi:hypothetical protein